MGRLEKLSVFFDWVVNWPIRGDRKQRRLARRKRQAVFSEWFFGAVQVMVSRLKVQQEME